MIIENLESEPHLFLYLSNDQRTRLNIDLFYYPVDQCKKWHKRHKIYTSLLSKPIKLFYTYQTILLLNVSIFFKEKMR